MDPFRIAAEDLDFVNVELDDLDDERREHRVEIAQGVERILREELFELELGAITDASGGFR